MGGLVFVLRGIQQMPLLQPPHHCSLTRSQAPRILLRGVLQESCPFLVCKSWKLLLFFFFLEIISQKSGRGDEKNKERIKKIAKRSQLYKNDDKVRL